jgi:hypothetical protein
LGKFLPKELTINNIQKNNMRKITDWYIITVPKEKYIGQRVYEKETIDETNLIVSDGQTKWKVNIEDILLSRFAILDKSNKRVRYKNYFSDVEDYLYNKEGYTVIYQVLTPFGWEDFTEFVPILEDEMKKVRGKELTEIDE